MKRPQSFVAIGIVLSAACYAQHCPDPTQRRATVGGDTIEGSVSLHQKPLKFSELQLSSNGKTTWVGATGHDGSFHIRGLRPGTYRLTVSRWGSTTIRVSPDLTKSFGNRQSPLYELLLQDDGCIMALTVFN
jgi:hypothetical protein